MIACLVDRMCYCAIGGCVCGWDADSDLHEDNQDSRDHGEATRRRRFVIYIAAGAATLLHVGIEP